ncbi:MAG: hypothetical protein HFH53_03350 [Hespellia sp.]|nr:hypothetical protein [Hespellia sp.]
MREIKNNLKTYNGIYFRPAAMNMVEEGGKIWMALANRNGICEVDKKTRKARICRVFDGEPLSKQLLYCCVEKVENKLIFSPGMADKIAVYDLEEDFITYIPLRPLKRHYKMSQQEIKFWNVFHHNFNVYLIGYSYPAIIKLDTKSMQVEYITDWVEAIEKNIKEEDTCGYFSDGHIISGDVALLSISSMKAVLELNLKSSHTKIRELKISTKGIGGLSSTDGENIWLVGKERGTNVVAHWNRRIESMEEFFIEDMDENIYDPFYAPVCTDSKIFLMPLAAAHIYVLDKNDGKIEKKRMAEWLISDSRSPFWMAWRVMAVRYQDKHLSFLSGDDFSWYEYNVETNENQKFFIYWEDEIRAVEQYFEDVCLESEKENIKLPEMRVPLEYFINTRVQRNDRYEKRNVGKKIYDLLC